MATFWQDNTQQSSGLAIKYLEYKGGVFQFYNSDLKKNEVVNLTEFIVLKTWYSITWRSEARHCKIYSNETDAPKWPFNMKAAADKSTIWFGEYDKDKTKPAINAAGWKLTYVITALYNDKLYKLQFNWTAYKEAGDFVQKFANNINKYKIKFDGSEPHQKGTVKWFTPKLAKGSEITEVEKEAAEMVVESLSSSD